ncbi:hypothetical protein GGI64_003962 [Rhizobium leguminosarum]|uniref:Uncharacterized protein n=1 Tax=Rhizobium leguminosarum TaxID=384 RepID=A0A7W9ZTS6_RHILE|nr:hypothetical protein [Rhizobium leguminosarum]MBB5667359.1 hypothetical protein [Rhizobium leguminosarum]MBB6222023.1 hypothetical protein [Rhizobium leguminosarum]NYJ12888.1 hypothetical protein [Rhizobium leguminosarum]
MKYPLGQSVPAAVSARRLDTASNDTLGLGIDPQTEHILDLVPISPANGLGWDRDIWMTLSQRRASEKTRKGRRSTFEVLRNFILKSVPI